MVLLISSTQAGTHLARPSPVGFLKPTQKQKKQIPSEEREYKPNARSPKPILLEVPRLHTAQRPQTGVDPHVPVPYLLQHRVGHHHLTRTGGESTGVCSPTL